MENEESIKSINQTDNKYIFVTGDSFSWHLCCDAPFICRIYGIGIKSSDGQQKLY
jgi:hypothetical protein